MLPAKRPIDILVAKMEADLERNPNDGKRWEEIGRAYTYRSNVSMMQWGHGEMHCEFLARAPSANPISANR